ncbi:hypothetical protein KAU11_06475, partial [Candidatus Babeliales bacterium]|nr:hypothetical protein [Candidatus Babeliales bacterium]
MTKLSTEGFDKRAGQIKAALISNEGKMPTGTPAADSNLLSASAIQAGLLTDMKESVRQVESLRKGGRSERAIDLSLLDFVKGKYGFGSLDSFYGALGVAPHSFTIEQLSTMPDFNEGYRWLVPEVIREAVRLGLRRNPIYPNLIAGEESVNQKSVIMPSVNMSAAIPEVLAETETIPVGSVSFNEKTVKLQRMGTGLKVSDDVQKYVSLNILSLYLQDAGVQLASGLDTMAIDVAINGDDAAGTFAAPVIGVEATADGITYYDLLRTWLRMGRLGRTPSGMISNEDAALAILQMNEFKGANYNNVKQNINLRTPIPQSQEYLIHGAMPTGNKLGFIDKAAGLIKLNAEALTVESDRIVERKLNATYVTVTTGFAKLFRDAFIVLDGTLA